MNTLSLLVSNAPPLKPAALSMNAQPATVVLPLRVAIPPARQAVFSVNLQSSTVTVENDSRIAPPKLEAELPEKVNLASFLASLLTGLWLGSGSGVGG